MKQGRRLSPGGLVHSGHVRTIFRTVIQPLSGLFVRQQSPCDGPQQVLWLPRAPEDVNHIWPHVSLRVKDSATSSVPAPLAQAHRSRFIGLKTQPDVVFSLKWPSFQTPLNKKQEPPS